jgi:hypothetical protein
MDDQLAVRAVDSLATSLPPAQVFPTLSQIVHQYFNNKTDPNQRRAALLALGVVVEGCSEFMRPHMDELWPFVLNGFKDEDASVRKAACTCLGCITEWLEDSCIEKHEILVPVCPPIAAVIHRPNSISFPTGAAQPRPRSCYTRSRLYGSRRLARALR